MTLSFEQFKTRVSNEILNYLPEEFQNAEVKTSTMQKLGDSYIALTLPRENNEAIPAVNLEKYYDKYLPEMWKNVTPEALEASHGGMDYFEFQAFCDCLRNGKEMPIDVYDAAAWMSIAYLTEKSIALGGASVEIPDFTNGKYKLRPPQSVVEL